MPSFPTKEVCTKLGTVHGRLTPRTPALRTSHSRTWHQPRPRHHYRHTVEASLEENPDNHLTPTAKRTRYVRLRGTVSPSVGARRIGRSDVPLSFDQAPIRSSSVAQVPALQAAGNLPSRSEGLLSRGYRRRGRSAERRWSRRGVAADPLPAASRR